MFSGSGAPERHEGWRDTPSNVAQTIDTWSLGCVFSIAATWVVLGYQGICQFNEMRWKAIRKILRDQEALPITQWSKSSLGQGYYFHDGCQALAAVSEWHNVVRDAMRRSDTVTGQILDLVDQKMLLGDAGLRIDATQICQELDDILIQARRKPPTALPMNVRKFLCEINDEAPLNPSAIRSVEIGSAKGDTPTITMTRKMKLSHVPLLKTSYRSIILKLTPESQNEVRDYEGGWSTPGKAMVQSLPYGPQMSQIGADLPWRTQTHPPISLSGTTNLQFWRKTQGHQLSGETMAQKVQKLRGNAGQNVFQAREEVEQREVEYFGSAKRKDNLLSRHFGNRDIVSTIIFHSLGHMIYHLLTQK
jgi:hypothetical protein